MKNNPTGIYQNIKSQGERRQLPPALSEVLKWLAVGITLFNFWAVFGYPETILHRSLGFGLFFALIFLWYTSPGSLSKKSIPWYDWLLAGLSLTVSVYIWANLDRFVTRFPFVDAIFPADFSFGIITVLLLLEGARRVTGPWLSLLSLAALAYALWGQYIPGGFAHNGFSAADIIDELFMTTDGIWGGILGIAVTYIVIFITFGAFMQNSGAGNLLFRLAAALAGKSRGGPAKIGVIASALFGMISGSAAANVTTSGSITIPMMKKTGYPADFSAAVECCASTGGAILPPVMGSVAFIMAEVIGVPYVKVALAAAIPAIIYYAALFFTVHFRAGKMQLQGMKKAEIPPFWKTLLEGITFFLPLCYLVFRLMAGYSPSRVGLETVFLVFLVSWCRKETRMGFTKTIKALSEGTTQGIMIISTMAASGIILGVINLTGIGTKFSALLMMLSGQSLFWTLFLTMSLTVFLGLAMNITPSYLLAAVIAGPALVKLGVPVMAAHLFILYYAAMATMTPPVAATAFTAAGIAEAPPMWVGFLSMRIGIIAYIMPFLFIYQPALLLNDAWPMIIVAFGTGLLSVALLAVGTEGWLGCNLRPLPRILFCGAGLLALTGWPPLLASMLVVLLIIYLLKRSGNYEKVTRSSPHLPVTEPVAGRID